MTHPTSIHLMGVAALLKDLSYRDILTLAKAMDPDGSPDEITQLVQMLLSAADKLLPKEG